MAGFLPFSLHTPHKKRLCRFQRPVIIVVVVIVAVVVVVMDIVSFATLYILKLTLFLLHIEIYPLHPASHEFNLNLESVPGLGLDC